MKVVDACSPSFWISNHVGKQKCGTDCGNREACEEHKLRYTKHHPPKASLDQIAVGPARNPTGFSVGVRVDSASKLNLDVLGRFGVVHSHCDDRFTNRA